MVERLIRRAFVPALLLGLLACPARGPDEGPVRTTPPPAPEGGAITIAYPYEPVTLDPFTRGGDLLGTRDLLAFVAPALYRNGAPSLLAEEPRAVAAPTEVTFTLRAARWSDGIPITVRDLRYTWRRAINAKRPWTRDPYDRVSSVEQVTPTQARVTFTQPFARWRDLFSVVLPAHAGTQGFRKASGGPFVLNRWRRGLDMSFERNPNAMVAPQLDRVRVAFVPDAAGALELLRRGTVNVAGPYVVPDMQRRIRAIRGASVASVQNGAWMGVVFNTATAPIRQRAVRRALALSIDRERVVDGLVQAEGARIDRIPGVDGAAFDPNGDLAEARRVLDAAGWRGTPTRSRDGRDLSLTLAIQAEDDLSGIVGRAIQHQVARAGVSLELVPFDPEGFTEWVEGARFKAAIVVRRDAAPRALLGAARPFNMARLRDAPLDEQFAASDRGQAAAVGSRLEGLTPVIPVAGLVVSLGVRDVEQVRPAAAAPFGNVEEWRTG